MKSGKKIGSWILALIMLAVLIGLLFIEGQRQSIRSKQLKDEAAMTKTDSSVVEEEPMPEEKQEEKEAPEEKPEETVKTPEIALSFRGDSYNPEEGADKSTGYPAKVEALLKDNNVDPTVIDATWDLAGTLSQLALAGVDQGVIDTYIANHQAVAAAAGINPALQEIQVRIDLADFLSERQDKAMIPVISMGYNGGYNNDVQELIAQQELILNTYDQKDRYLILGFYPNGWTDPAGYDQAMQERWGEHYVSLNSTLSVSDFSDTQRQEIADAVYKKLVELKYF